MIRRTLLALVLALSAAMPVTAAPTTLVILHTNDTHDHLTPYDKKELKSIGGIARRATMIKQAKSGAPDKVLVLDAGDTFQGTPIFNFFHGKADYEAMDAAGYDATTVGNHDLDDGFANLVKQHNGRKFKLINTNLVDVKSGKNLFIPYAMYQRAGLQVGIFGILGEGSAWSSIAATNQAGIKVLDRIPVAKKAVADLKAKGADLIVMLSHSGLQEDKDLAAQVSGIHVIVGGHSHTKVDAPIPVKNGDWTTYVLQAYQWGEYIGRFELEVDGGKVTNAFGTLVPVAGDTPEDPDVAKIVKGYDAQISAKMGVVIGQAPKGLSVESKYERDCELGSWAADLIRVKTGAQIGFLNAGGLRAAINPGPVRIGDIYSVFPFENRVVSLEMKGDLILRLLDLVTTKKASMLQVSGISFQIAGDKAVDVTVDGKPLDPAKTYKVATIDYMAQGNDRYTVFPEAGGFKDSGLLLRDAVIDWVKGHPSLEPPTEHRIRVGG